MLDKTVFIAEIKKLGYVYQHFTMGNTKEEITNKLEAWYEVFENYDEADFLNSIKTFKQNSAFPPQSPADLKQYYKPHNELLAEESFNKVLNLIAKHGSSIKTVWTGEEFIKVGGFEEIYKHLTPIEARAVKSLESRFKTLSVDDKVFVLKDYKNVLESLKQANYCILESNQHIRITLDEAKRMIKEKGDE